MRIHDQGDYAYDLEQATDPATQLRTGWNFRVFRLRPIEQIVAKGGAATREEAEKQARRVIARVLQAEKQAA